jgi:hypothetical protein
MFDRRYAVYGAARDFIIAIVQMADEPERETTRSFLVALGESVFLFDAAVHEGLQAIWKNACAYFALRKTMKHAYEIHGHYGDGNPDRDAKLLTWFSEQLAGLPALFGDELRLALNPSDR